MDKIIEALDRIKKSHYTAIAIMGCERDIETENAIATVEKELQRLAQIDKANPSEALSKYKTIYTLAAMYVHNETGSEENSQDLLKRIKGYNDVITNALERPYMINNTEFNNALDSLDKIIHSFDEEHYDKESEEERIYIENYFKDRFETELEAIASCLSKVKSLEEENTKNKQLEKDLGCSFDVVLNAQKNGIIFKTKIRNKDCELCSNDYTLSLDFIENVGWVFHIIDGDILVETLKLSDHNKAWWLIKDKCE